MSYTKQTVFMISQKRPDLKKGFGSVSRCYRLYPDGRCLSSFLGVKMNLSKTGANAL